jgi:hypothetical protein
MEKKLKRRQGVEGKQEVEEKTRSWSQKKKIKRREPNSRR